MRLARPLPRQTVSFEADGIFRVWLAVERARNSDLPLTDAARMAKEAWDSVADDPQIGCIPLGMPGTMFSPHPIEFVERGEDIILRLEEWDGLRIIHLNPGSSTDNESDPRMGYSVGHWEDNTLVVTTTDIRYPYMDEQGTSQSEAVEVVERFTLSADERNLDWELAITDPGTLTESFVAFTTRWRWGPGEELQSYDCAVR